MQCPLLPLTNAFKAIADEQAVVAGGAAACFEKADDIDIFVLDGKVETGVRIGQRLLDQFGHHTAALWEQTPGKIKSWFYEDGQYGAGIENFMELRSYEGEPKEELLVAHYVGITQPYHVIVRPGQSLTVDQLLRSFDLSVHMWALDRSVKKRIGCEFSTEINEPIRIVNPRLYSLKRAMKLADRYGVAVELAVEAPMEGAEEEGNVVVSE